MGIASKGISFFNVIPNLSPISISSALNPLANTQSNDLTIDPRANGKTLVANGKAGHIRRPDPNGKNSKCCPLKSLGFGSDINLSGLNKIGSTHVLGSRPMAQTFTKICVSLGIVYLSNTWHVDMALCGTRKGSGGCSLRVSLITAERYGRFGRSSSWSFWFWDFMYVRSSV